MTTTVTTDTSPDGFRARAIRHGIRFSWLAVVLMGVEALRLGALSEPQAIAALLSVAGTLAALSLINWEQVANHLVGSVLLALWSIISLMAMSAALSIEDLGPALLGVYLASIVFVAVIGSTIPLAMYTFVAAASYLTIPLYFGHTRTLGSLTIPVAAFIAAASIARMLTDAYHREVVQARTSVEALRRQEQNFERLYEVSRTLATGDSLANVVPQLVGKIGTYLDAEVGVVLLKDDSGTMLEVLSPIWAAGHSLEVAGYRIDLQRGDALATLFKTGKAQVFEDIAREPDRWGILGELGLRSAMAAPLRVEGRTIGVLLVGDKSSSPFDEADMDDLISLAAPAALVLAQLDRYEEAAETGRRMEELARMKTDFVSVVSHELRTPLTSIIGALATLDRPELAPERTAARELLSSARNQADRLRRLIEDLLMVARIENRALPQQPEELKLEVFLRDVVSGIPGANDLVRLEVHREAAEIEADPDHLERIVINLVQNAIKYAPDSPIELMVMPAPAHMVALSVIDHGPGISPEASKRVFERFQQLDGSSTRSQGGTGLGLNIVKGLVTGMGGRIELSQTPGGGATFTVMLPRQPGSLPSSAITIV